jgi:hypothetical protein
MVDDGIRVPGAADRRSANGDTLDIIVDDIDAARVEITAYWKRLTADDVEGAYGPTVLSDESLNADSDVRFIPAITTPGNYGVYLYWPALRDPSPTLATDARITVRHAGGEQHFRINQKESPKEWRLLGHFPFAPGKPGHVQFITDEANGIVLADAVRFRLVDSGGMP